jgi:hypothetical protein
MLLRARRCAFPAALRRVRCFLLFPPNETRTGRGGGAVGQRAGSGRGGAISGGRRWRRGLQGESRPGLERGTLGAAASEGGAGSQTHRRRRTAQRRCSTSSPSSCSPRSRDSHRLGLGVPDDDALVESAVGAKNCLLGPQTWQHIQAAATPHEAPGSKKKRMKR